jgi:hypothetical protein
LSTSGDPVLWGRTYFRINPVKSRTRAEHMDELLEYLKTECRGER